MSCNHRLCKELIKPTEPPKPGYERCCDATGCADYKAEHRNPYWPKFAHPKWLSCAELYGGDCPCKHQPEPPVVHMPKPGAPPEQRPTKPCPRCGRIDCRGAGR